MKTLINQRIFDLKSKWLNITWVVLMLLAFSFVVESFQIEDALNFSQLFIAASAAFVLHLFIPRQYSVEGFCVLTAIAAIFFFGWYSAMVLTGIAVLLFMVVHARISFQLRAGILLLLTLLFVLMKSGMIPDYIPSNVISILAGLFMFRLILYWYEIRHYDLNITRSKRFAYFFMLPNLVMPLFPVVDLKTFNKTWYNEDEDKIYLKGMKLIARGITHLLLYRIIYLFAIPVFSEVDNVWSLLQYVVMSYTLILRLSGLFHIAVGILRLFGFNLPDVFNNYFLADGFNDYWRRINIYWKDFMLKVFYYPIYFKFKKHSPILRIIITTLLVFVVNWFLHAYQWFWMVGRFKISATDIFFWMSFGVLVTASAVLQVKRHSASSASLFKKTWERSFRIVGTFMTIAILWSIWISPTFADWFTLMRPLTFSFVQDLYLLLFIAMIGMFGGLLLYVYNTNHVLRNIENWFEARVNNFYTMLFLVLTISVTDSGSALLSENLGIDISQVMRPELNENDQSSQFEGYYEEILTGHEFTTGLWGIEDEEDEDWVKLKDIDIIAASGDILIKHLIPSSQTTFKGSLLTSNRWGFRDKEYELLPPANGKRLAVIGGSIEMGSGVSNDEVFEQVIEDRFNLEYDELNYESLNFALGARSLIQNTYNFEKNILPFKPTHIILFNHDREWDATLNVFGKVLNGKKVSEFPYPYLNDIIKQAGLDSNSSKTEVKQALKPYMMDIMSWCYSRIIKVCEENGIEAIWAHIPNLNERRSVEPEYEVMRKLAQETGFKCIGSNNVYKGYNKLELSLSKGDNHPNQKGHQVIADRLYPELVEIFVK